MTATPRRRCPVCYRRIKPTTGGLIFGHWDTAGEVCPASWLSYDVTITGDRRRPHLTEPEEVIPA